MPNHTVKAFDEELQVISAKIAHMGGLCESQLAASIEALTRRDSALAERIIADDVRIDRLEREIEESVVKVLALRQPMALDLRECIAAFKISSDLERIGDLAKNTAKRAIALNSEPPSRAAKGAARMGRLVMRQLKEALDSYSARDAALAQEVWRRDEEADELYNSLFRELLTYMMEDPRTIGMCAHYLFVAKNLERIGDHATNVAENVHYIVKGAPLTEERPKGDITSLTPPSETIDAG